MSRRVVKNDKVVSLAHEIARVALRTYNGDERIDHRWVRSETKSTVDESGAIRVRIRAEILWTPGKPDGVWVTISTTLRMSGHTLFPGPKVTVEFPWDKKTFCVHSFEGAYRHLEDFRMRKEETPLISSSEERRRELEKIYGRTTVDAAISLLEWENLMEHRRLQQT